MPELTITLFGVLQVRLADTTIQLGTVKVQALLAYLATEAGIPHTRDSLMGLLWPDFSTDSARQNLRQTLFRLRQSIPPQYFIITKQTVQFNYAVPCQLDVAAFTNLLTECRRHVHGDITKCTECIQRMDLAAGLYRGDFLAGLFLNDCPAFEEWQLLKREWLRREELTILDKLATYHEHSGQYDQAYQAAWQQIKLDPVCEEAHQKLIRALALSGRRSEALAQYDSCRHLLAEELGVEPGAATVALYEEVRSGKFLGEQRQQEQAQRPLEPVVISSAHTAEIGRFISMPQPLPIRSTNNLPTPLTSFVGREHEMAMVLHLLTQTRLLTLTGAGGSGKTRLALQIGRELIERYRDGVWFVELAPLVDPALVEKTVAAGLGLQEQPGRTLSETLTETIQSQHLLLILDNCEHLALSCAQLVETLLQAGPKLQILVTSRESLSIGAEISWRVPGLARPPVGSCPSAAELSRFASVQLFVARAASTAPAFRLNDQNAPAIAQICRRLDGLPLALELAAVRIKLLTPEQIVARLDDRFRLLTTENRTAPWRHQTLRTTVDWSFNLLTEDERVLLRRLAVFSGGFTLDAVNAIADLAPESVSDGHVETPLISLPGDKLLDLLGRLVDKSLVVVDREPTGNLRYRLLETIRQYAMERLVASEEEALLHTRHAAYYTTLAETTWPYLNGPQSRGWIQHLDSEIDNLRAALTWCLIGAGAAEMGLRLAGALGLFWTHHLSEGYYWLELALSRTTTLGPSVARARALCYAGDVANSLGDLAAAKPRVEEGITILRELNDKASLARALTLLPEILRDCGEYEKIPSVAEECLDLCQEIGDKWGSAWALGELAGDAIEKKDFTTADSYCRQATCLYKEAGDKQGCALTYHLLGIAAEYQGNYATARRLFGDALAFFRELEDNVLIAMELNSLGIALHYVGDREEALNMFCESLTITRDIGFTLLIPYCLASIAGVALAEGRLECTAQLCGAVEQLCASRGICLQPRYRTIYERLVITLQEKFDGEALVAAWAEGQALTREEVIQLALEIPALLQVKPFK